MALWPELPQGYAIRRRRPTDDPVLLAVENRAAELFRDYGYPAVADAPIPDVGPLRAMMEGQEVWVAVDRDDIAVGLAVAGEVAGFLHLKELSVDPAHGRNGLGAALVDTVHDKARADGRTGTSLTTFRDVPFNAPFYTRLGFTELPLDAAPEELRKLFLAEVPAGVSPQSRVLMIRPA